MKNLKCRIVLETWYQETPKENIIEVLPETFTSLDEALEFLSLNYENLLDNFPVVGLHVK